MNKVASQESKASSIDKKLGELEKAVESINIKLSKLKIKLLGIEPLNSVKNQKETVKEAREPGWFDKVCRRLTVLNEKIETIDISLIDRLISATGTEDIGIKRIVKDEND